MAEFDIPLAPRIRLGGAAIFELQRLVSLTIGGVGGALESVLLATPLVQGVIYGALFGLAFSFFFSRNHSRCGIYLGRGRRSAGVARRTGGDSGYAPWRPSDGHVERCTGEVSPNSSRS